MIFSKKCVFFLENLGVLLSKICPKRAKLQLQLAKIPYISDKNFGYHLNAWYQETLKSVGLRFSSNFYVFWATLMCPLLSFVHYFLSIFFIFLLEFIEFSKLNLKKVLLNLKIWWIICSYLFASSISKIWQFSKYTTP